MEIDFAAVARFEKTELAGGIGALDRSRRRAVVLLHRALKPANVILQPAPRTLEGVVDGERQIGMPLVRRRGAADIDLAAVRQREANVHLVKSAVLMVSARRAQCDPAARHPAISLLELGDMLCNGILDLRRTRQALKIDFERC